MSIKKIVASVLAAFVSFGVATGAPTFAADDTKTEDKKIQEILQEKIIEQKEAIKKLEKELENQKSKPKREIIIHERKVQSKEKSKNDDPAEKYIWFSCCLTAFGMVSFVLLTACVILLG